MSRARPDFVNIQLTAAGRRMAGEHGVVGWANSHRNFEFRAGQVHEVERSFEWRVLLKNERFEGEAILEEVPDEVLEEAVAEDAAEISSSETNIEAGVEQSAGKSKRKG